MAKPLDLPRRSLGKSGFAWLVLWIGSISGFGQTPDDWTARLNDTQGIDRVPLIAEFLTQEDPRRHPQQAVDLGLEALSHLANAPDPRLELEITCGLCRAHVANGDPETAIRQGNECLKMAEQQEAPGWLAWGHLWCLNRSYASREQLGLAVVHGNRAIELYERQETPEDLASALTLTAMELADLGDWTNALEYHQRARIHFQSVGDLRGEAVTLLRIGTVHSDLEDQDLSFEYAEKAYEAFQKAGSDIGVAAALNNMAMAAIENQQYDQALQILNESLEIKERLKEPRSIALTLINIGNVRRDQGKLREASAQLSQARAMLQELGAARELAHVSLGLAQVHQQQGQLDEALKEVRQAIDSSEQLGFQEVRIEGYQFLAELHEARGDLTAALAAWRHYDEIKSGLLNATNAQRTVEMEVRYRAESQAQEIRALKERQALQTLEVQSQRNTRTAMVIGFALVLAVLALLFNRYRLQTQAARMEEAVAHEKAVSAGLREVDRLKDAFLANTSHELRTPLYGMMGLAESLLDGASGELPPAARKSLELIQGSGARLSQLVTDILDAEKLRQQGMELACTPVDLHTLADIVLTLAEPLVRDRPVELINRVPSNLPAAWADTDRVQQVLHNLVGNAVKFTEHGSVTVDAALEEDDTLVVRVTDTGIGIEPEAQRKIFQAFEQADASIERTYGGTGLGLALSRELVRLHGGDLWVESTLGEGATFLFTLPQAIERPEKPTPERLILVPPEPRPTEDDAESLVPTVTTRETATVLVVDDEPINRQVLANHLSPGGYRILMASSGAEALDRLEQEPVDIVLLDIMMPRMSGYEVCRRIRGQHSREALPIILLSAKNEAADRIAGFEVGGNDYLAKPIAKQELLKRVDTQLELLLAHRAQAQELEVLRQLVTLCASCKNIRDPEGQWDAIESYMNRHSTITFSHGLCPNCVEKLYPDIASKL